MTFPNSHNIILTCVAVPILGLTVIGVSARVTNAFLSTPPAYQKDQVPQDPVPPRDNALTNNSKIYKSDEEGLKVSSLGKSVRAAQRLIDLMNQDDQDGIQMIFSPGMREIMPKFRMTDVSRDIIRRRGKLLQLGVPSLTGRVARIPITAELGEWRLILTLNAKGEVIGIAFEDPVPPIPVPERNRIPMRLPFDGVWKVISGCPTQAQNHHLTLGTDCQRRALDFAIRDPDRNYHSGDGARNEDYYAYGRDVLAPADGVAVVVVDGVPDNRPGSVNPYTSGGNTLVLKHSPEEFSVFFHLQPGSFRIKAGSPVKAGDIVARCGNSGNSAIPHLHFHLMNSEVPQDATGFPPYFRRLRVNGRLVDQEYSPVKDDSVESIALDQ